MARRPVQPSDSSWPYLAPSDLRQHDLPSQAALGFHRGSTEELLDRAADTIERLNRDLAEIRQAREGWKRERERLGGQLEDAKKQAELLVGEAMVDAHKASQALRAQAEADAEALRAEAEALLEPARREAERLVDEARAQAEQLVADARGEVEQLSAQAEQYKLLAADVQSRSVAFLHRALEALGEEVPAAPEVGEDVAPFRSADRRASGE